MTSIGSPSPLFFGGKKAYEIERSLRFNDNDSAYLNKTPSSSSNRKTFTISWWFKIGNSGTVRAFFGAYDNSTSSNDSYYLGMLLGSDDKLFFSAWNTLWRKTTRVFRDPNAWYHCVLAVDTTQSTGADRVKLYINGVEETSFVNNNNPSQNFDLGWNFSSQMQTIGRVNYLSGSGPYPFDGYIAEVNSIDGLQLTPSSFAETDAITGQWNPKKYVGSYGTNGFYLNFSDNSGTTATTLGKDSSGNGNNFTPNNFSVAAGTGNDSLEDTPTNNFCTLNALDKTNDASLRDGALTLYTDANDQAATGTFGITSGKWYWEVDKNATEPEIGIAHFQMPLSSKSTSLPSDGQIAFIVSGADSNTNFLRINGSTATGTGMSAQTGTGSLGIALDMDNKKIWWSDLSGNYFNSGNPATGANAQVDFSSTGEFPNGVTPIVCIYQGSAKTTSINFGQRPFTHTAPTGFKTLCTANLPDPTIKIPNKHFAAFTYTGTGSYGTDYTFTDSDVDFTPDLVWIKGRAVAQQYTVTDSLRGAAKQLAVDTAAETTNAHRVNSFVQGGFTSGTDGITNWPSRDFVAWNWNAGGSTVTNNDGNNTSQVRANTSAGFSIVGYTGTGANNTLVTMGHGLGVKPDAVLIKNRDSTSEWVAWINGVGGSATDNQKNLGLNTYAAAGQNSSQFRTSDSTTFTVRDTDSNGNIKVNKSGDDYIAYVFSSVQGYSKFAKYTGNGNANGTFIYLGFKPAYFVLKGLTSNSWYVYDNKRDPINPVDKEFNFNNTQAEASSYDIDFLSNGVKMRTNNSSWNYNNYEYVYMAFAESPFKYARAR